MCEREHKATSFRRRNPLPRKPGRRRQTSRKTKALPAAWEKLLVGRIIKEANLSASDFVGWLESALEGRDVAWSA
jgi:hypothetical protein